MKKKGKRMLAMSLAVMIASSTCYGVTVHAEDVNALETTDTVQGVEKEKTVEEESAVEADKNSVSDESKQDAAQSGRIDSDAGNAVETESSDAGQDENDQAELWDVSLKSDNTIAIQHYKGTLEEVVIPDTMKYNGQDYPVSEIRWNSFISNASIQKITISKNVKTIGENAFRECTNLEEVIFASDAELQTIEDGVFFGDTALKIISIPASVEAIGVNVFRECTALESADLTKAVKLTAINSSTFCGDTALKSITIPENVESIESNAFACCKNITEIRFSNDGKLKSIGNSAFSVTGVEKVVIPESVESIGTGAFFKLSGKLKVYGAAGSAAEQYCQVTSGADFYDASNIYLNEEASISVTAGSSSYQIKVEWPESMEDVQWTSSNESVATVDGNGLVTKVKKGTVTITAVRGKNSRSVEITFSGSEQEEAEEEASWDISLKSDDTVAINKYKGTKAEVVIPDEMKYNGRYYKVQKIGRAAFQDNQSIQKLWVSENIKEIDNQAFARCTNLTSVNFNGTSKLQTIGTSAFYGDTALKEIIIPADVETIGMNAFRECAGLESVDLTNADKLTTINSSVFYEDAALKNITIPKNVESIDDNAFAGCKSITEIYFSGDGKLKSIGNSAFSRTGIVKAVIPESVESIGTDAFFKLSGRVKIYGQAGSSAERYCQSAGDADFYDVSGIYLNEDSKVSVPADQSAYQIKVDWPESMEDVQWTSSDESIATVDANGLVTRVHKGTVNITAERSSMSCTIELTFNGDDQEDQKEAEEWSFSKKEDGTLKIQKYTGGDMEISVPKVLKYRGRYYKVSEIDDYAFGSNDDITKVSIPSGIKQIGERAFNYCTNLQSVELEKGSELEVIGESAFSRCGSLKSINLQDAAELSKIGEDAFYENTSLASIVIPANVQEIEAYTFADCESLTDIDFSKAEKLTTVGTNAFRNIGAAEIEVPDSITEIGNAAFSRAEWELLYVYGEEGSAAEAYCDTTERNVEFRYAKGVYLEQSEEGLYFDIESLGEALQLNVEWPKDAAKGEIHWSSSEPERIFVDQNGKVTAINYGTAEITAERNGYTDTVNIDVVQRSISEADIILEGIECTYNGKAFTPEVTVVDGDKVLEENVDYEVTYSDNIKAGVATVTVAGIGKYTGEVDRFFTILPKVSYRTQVQTYGWEKNYTSNGGVSGTMGQGKRLETIQIKAEGADNLDIEYRTHVQSFGWQNWTSNGANSGTVGLSKRLEAIQVRLKGDDAERYDIYYRVHAQNYGWLNWAKNGEYAGTAGLSKRLEAIQIVVVEKGADAPENVGGIASTNKLSYVHTTHNWDGGKVTKEPESYTKNGIKTYTCTECGETKTEQILKSFPVDVSYRTQVQTYGWQKTVKNGQIAGTMGQSKRMETMAISVKDLVGADSDLGIRYNAHVQSIGWQGDVNDSTTWKKDGENAGTVGMSKRLEAIQIELSGDDAEKYDVYYRVHAQTYGWLNWAKNGEIAGTAGYSKRLEGIQIIVVEKGAEINTSFGGIKSTNGHSYIVK